MENASEAIPGSKLPQAFVFRRLHSLLGFWLVLYIIEHLLVNSQAALFIGDDGSGFIRAVNGIHDLPYLPVIELMLLGVPIVLHAVWGIHYIFTAKYNSYATDGSKPDLRVYPRNHAYTWQRITSWILVVGIAAHVIHMRFIEYPMRAPEPASQGGAHAYMVRLEGDKGLYTLQERLNFSLYTPQQVAEIPHALPPENVTKHAKAHHVLHQRLISAQAAEQYKHWVDVLQSKPLQGGQLMAVAHDFGTAELLVVRDTFKSPLMLVLYTLLVLATCFHAFNGLWTFMISWGVTLSEYSQKIMRCVTTALMILVSFLGLAAIWGTYWINLYH